MLQTVTKYLVQKRNCTLPCIGEFKILRRSAETDAATKKILPPVDEIVFTPGSNLKPPDELLNYIAREKKLDKESAELYLKNYCEEWTNTVMKGGSVEFSSFGSLEKNQVGKIYFKAYPQPKYRTALVAEAILNEDVDHPVLVGDKETSSAEINNPVIEEETVNAKDKSWWVFAAILLAFGLLGLFKHFNSTGYSIHSIGNDKKDIPDTMRLINLSHNIK